MEPNEAIEKLIKDLDLKNGVEIFGQGGLVKQITKRLVETALEAEMDGHLGYKKGERAPAPSG
jgi:putative transposase